MMIQLRQLYSSRELLWNWTHREFRVRYSQAILGVLWTVLQPIALMLIFTVVFSSILRVDTGSIPYPAFVYIGLLSWNFFAGAVSAASSSVGDHMSIVSKVAFPREVLPFSIILVSLFDFLIAASIFVVLLAYYQILIGTAALFVPVIVLAEMALMTGISLLAASVYVRYRDLRFIVPIVLQMWFFINPIFYAVQNVPQQFQTLYYFNPMAVFIEAFRSVIFRNQLPDPVSFGIASGVSLLVLLIGYAAFKQAESKFADVA